MATFLIGLGGKYIWYPELHKDNTGMFCRDKVHISEMGNTMLLYRLQLALQAFSNDSSVTKLAMAATSCWFKYYLLIELLMVYTIVLAHLV